MEEERRRREEAERRLQDETAHRQRLVEEEVKMREKHFSQVSGAGGGVRGRGVHRRIKGCGGRSSKREEQQNRLLLWTMLHVTQCNDSVMTV